MVGRHIQPRRTARRRPAVTGFWTQLTQDAGIDDRLPRCHHAAQPAPVRVVPGGSPMPELPSGTVTFLFTDIEGSTKRWQQFPEAMKASVARHDALLRREIELRGGHVFKTVG